MKNPPNLWEKMFFFQMFQASNKQIQVIVPWKCAVWWRSLLFKRWSCMTYIERKKDFQGEQDLPFTLFNVNNMYYFIPLDPKTMKNDEKWRFWTPNVWVITPRNKGNMGSHGMKYHYSHQIQPLCPRHGVDIQLRPLENPIFPPTTSDAPEIRRQRP